MNDIGKTIIMVTHDLQMASYCSSVDSIERWSDIGGFKE